MKLESESSNTIIIGKVQKGDYKMGDLTKIFSILHTQIYSDKVLAPIRELVCNAHDSHVAANTKRRFQIHMPTQDACYFSIRDFGTGMTEEEVVELYTTYGASTKDNSNEAVGCFGIGSKAPFAYTDRFEVIAFKDGRMNVYQCLVDEGVPKFIQYDSTDTDEPNGMLIKFDVNQYDKSDFNEAMGKMFFFQDEIEFVDGGYVTFHGIPDFTNDFALFNYWGVEMGGVLYPISRNDLDQVSFLRKLDGPLHYGQGYIIHVELGDVDITASRETINWTTKSKECLGRKAKYLMDNAEAMCRREMMKVKTIWAKLDAYANFLRKHPFLSKIRSIRDIAGRLPSGSIWNNSDRVSIVHKGYSNGTKSIRNLLESAQDKLTICAPNSDIKFVDITECKRPTDGIRGYSTNNPDDILVCVKDEAMLKFLKRLGAPIKTAAELEAYKPVRTPRPKSPKTKGAAADRAQILRGVRRFNGLDKAPEAVPSDWVDTTLKGNAENKIYYVLRDTPHSKFVVDDPWCHIFDDEACNNWYYFFTEASFRLYVISPKVLDKLRDEDVDNKLVDLLEEMKRIHGNKSKILDEYQKYGAMCSMATVYHHYLDSNVINPYIIEAVENKELKKLLKEFVATNGKRPLCPVGLLERTMFDTDSIERAVRVRIRSLMDDYRALLDRHFPLLSCIQHRDTDKHKEHVLKYSKMVRKEMLADAKKAVKAEESKNAENN